MCNQGLLVDPTNIALILSFPPSTNVKMLRATLGYMGYYRKFIKGYVAVTAPMDKLSKKDIKFQWNEQCQESPDVLNNKMFTMHILDFPNWKK